MRLFLAIRPPLDVIEFAVAAQEFIRPTIQRQGVRFAAPAKIHLTLAFLGDDRQEHQTSDAAERCITGSERLTLTAHRLGAFPSLLRPKTIWLGVDGDGLEALAHKIAAEFCLPTEPFHGHLTLARISPGSKAVGLALAPLVRAFDQNVTWHAESVELVSTLPNGEYQTLKTLSL